MNIFDFFEQRAKEIARGVLGYDRRSAIFFNNKPERRRLALANANNQARAERSDPFIANRVLSAIANGAAVPEDYSVTWREEQVVTQLSAPVKVSVLRPMSRKVA